MGAIGLVSLASLPTLRELAGISGGCQSVTLSRRISPGQVRQFATDGQRADSRSSIRSAVSMPASGRREALRGAGITIAIQHVARRTSATSQSDATGSLSAPGRRARRQAIQVWISTGSSETTRPMHLLPIPTAVGVQRHGREAKLSYNGNLLAENRP